MEKGPCGEVVGNYWEVEEEDVPEQMASCTTIRWLLSEKDSVPSFYMRLFTMGPKCHINAHYHPWEHEIFVLEGEGIVRIGARRYSVGPGSHIYVPPNVEHEYWSGSRGLRFLCMIPTRPTVEERGDPLVCGE